MAATATSDGCVEPYQILPGGLFDGEARFSLLCPIFPEIGQEEKLIAPPAPQPAGNDICDNWSARASRDTEFACRCSRGCLGQYGMGRPGWVGSVRSQTLIAALPFAMATARLPHWWQAWSQDRRLSCSVVVGNIHDLVTSLVSDNVDLMICYHHAQQPIHLDPDLYECVTLGIEFLRPYASEALVAKGGASLPGRASHPVPLLMYSPGVYFARLVDLILENAPIAGVRVIESDMSDVLCGMALSGRGVAWLTEGTVAAYGRKRLTLIGGDKWALPLSLVAFRGRMHDGQRALNLFWSELCRHSVGHAGGGLARTGSRLPAKRPGKLLS
jgi:DNA-binding transcriptional LysR family regulator